MGGYVISGVVMSKRSKDSPYVITATIIIAATIFLWSTSALANGSKTKYGITVTECNFDYDEENYCADSRMKAFAKVMEERSANFAGNRVLYIYKGDYFYRLVSMDKTTKKVQPFYWAFAPSEQAVNSKGEKMEFTFAKHSSEFCYKGNIEAYRNSYHYDPEDYPEFCFDYDKNKNAFGWFKQ